MAMYDVYSVVTNELGAKKGQSFWQRVGVAFTNKDGSLTIRLNAIPLDGKLVVRERQEKAAEAKVPLNPEPPAALPVTNGGEAVAEVEEIHV